MTTNDGALRRKNDSRAWRLAQLVGLSSLILIIGGALLFSLSRVVIGSITIFSGFQDAILALGYGIVGLLILKYQPGQRIGWLFMAVALVSALGNFSKYYALYGLVSASLPGAMWMAWLQNWLVSLVFPAPVILLFLLFPDGRLPSRYWRPVVWLGVSSAGLLVLGAIFMPGAIEVYLGSRAITVMANNPTGIIKWAGLNAVLNTAWFLSVIIFPAALLAPILRYRKAQIIERQQLKWFVFFAILSLLFLPFAFVGPDSAGEFIFLLELLILPVATAIAIMRYRLYEIDIIIKRTLLYGTLSVILSAVFFSSVVIFQSAFTTVSGQQSQAVIVLSTLIIAALFAPFRRRLQTFIDRRFYRKKYDAAQSLERFAAVSRDEVNIDRLTGALLAMVEETMQPERINLWLKQ